MWMQRVKLVWRPEPLRRCSDSPWRLVSIFPYSDVAEKKSKAAPLQVLQFYMHVASIDCHLYVFLEFIFVSVFLQETRMRDRFTLYAKGGDGGSGCSSVRRSRHDRRGRPDGVFHCDC